MIIGLTGRNASGKGEVAEYLKTRGFTFYSLSDVLREEMKKLKKPVTRTNLIWLGNKLRDEKGPSVLADGILTKLEDDHHYVIDSFRNPEEVKAFKRTKDFILICVEASPKVRFERMHLRNREQDAKTFSEFLQHEKKELHSDDPTKQNLLATAKLADYKVSNNSSMEVLHSQLSKLFTGLMMHRPRPSWDEYFMKIAQVVASRSNCMKRKVAALIVKDGRIISTGYNGTPRGTVNCSEGGCPRCNSFKPSGQGLSDCYCSHAEENAIVQASYHGISIKGASLYTTFSPCLICTKMIINSGIVEVVYNKAYSLGDEALKLLKQPHIKVRKLTSHGKNLK
ncbi:MAG: deaminase [Elusimicrobiota bacterium]